MLTKTLSVNNQKRQVGFFEDEPLLWVLRERLGLKAVKFGCGIGICGACTVLLNNQPVRSCSILAKDVDLPITTLEGIDKSHPVIRAWIDYQVPQCGYCQGGIIMSVYAMTLRKPLPSASSVLKTLSSHLCRCGTYERIAKAVRSIFPE